MMAKATKIGYEILSFELAPKVCAKTMREKEALRQAQTKLGKLERGFTPTPPRISAKE